MSRVSNAVDVMLECVDTPGFISPWDSYIQDLEDAAGEVIACWNGADGMSGAITQLTQVLYSRFKEE